jgi:hypothetical protein
MMLTAAFALSLIVNVSAPKDIPASVVSEALAEANRIWRPSGTTFVWRRESTLPAPLSVIIGRRAAPAEAATVPLGWVMFDADVPGAEIHLSYANAERLLDESRDLVTHSRVRMMTIVEHDTLLARALGRALAHELGHILLASKEHTRGGLMKATRTAFELFSPDAMRFEITAAQRAVIAARLQQQPLVASR